MISRRNIRIKAMQVLYEMEAIPDFTSFKDPVKELESSFLQSASLFTYLMHFMLDVTEFASQEAMRRSSRNIKTEDDLNFNTKISGNLVARGFLASLEWSVLYERYHAQWGIDPAVEDLQIKKAFSLLEKTEQYGIYIAESRNRVITDKQIFLYLLKTIIMKDEELDLYFRDNFPNWDDDADMIRILIENIIQKSSKELPAVLLSALDKTPKDFAERGTLFFSEKWDFARQLLETAVDKKDFVLDIIKKHLINWDSKRIAQLDMILMRLAICEFLYFETIPSKVSLNEYIDIAKDYSTDQSGTFINGILDKIEKELSLQGQIHKTDYRP